MRHINPKKLLLSKWTALEPVNRERHFMVTRLIEPAEPDGVVTEIELEAVLTRRVRRLPWRELRDATRWLQGWT
jgi:tryptophan-rich hypothetical protein